MVFVHLGSTIRALKGTCYIRVFVFQAELVAIEVVRTELRLKDFTETDVLQA